MNTAAGIANRRADRGAWTRTVALTAVAVAVYALLRWLPLAGGALHYTDFGAGQRGFLEFCEPGSPQFAPVDRVHSPVVLRVQGEIPLQAGAKAHLTARLETAGGKAVSRDDLLVVHTRPLHLLIVDASLEDYQHVHPEPSSDGESFTFAFTPQRAGRYRIFADFMPRATGRALYAGAELAVAAAPGEVTSARSVIRDERWESRAAGLVFRLTTETRPLRLNQTATIVLTVAREDGAPLELQDIMGAPAHLVAFDEACSGFAHLHPAPSSPELARRTDAGHRLGFALHLSDPGYYRLWAQVQVDGQEIFAPFGLRVEP